jgi:hypothetical protein
MIFEEREGPCQKGDDVRKLGNQNPTILFNNYFSPEVSRINENFLVSPRKVPTFIGLST